MNSLWIGLGLLAALVVFVVVKQQLSRRRFLAIRDEVDRALREGARLVDVRTASEFSGGHLAGALNLPLGELGAGARKLGEKGRTLVVYCASGSRSAVAVPLLTGLGYKRVLDLGAMANGKELPSLSAREDRK